MTGDPSLETLVTFVQLVRRDKELLRTLRELAASPIVDRAKLLTRTAALMRQNGVEERLVQVVEKLRDPLLLSQVLNIAEAEGPPSEFGSFFRRAIAAVRAAAAALAKPRRKRRGR